MNRSERGVKIFNLVISCFILKFTAHGFPFRLCTYSFRIFSFVYVLQFRKFHFIHMSLDVKFTVLLASCTSFLSTRPLDACHFVTFLTKVTFSLPYCKLYSHTQTYRVRVTLFRVAWNKWPLSEITFLRTELLTGEKI